MKPVYAALLCLWPGLGAAQPLPTIPVDEPAEKEATPSAHDSFARGYFVANSKLDNDDGATYTADSGLGVGGVLGFGPAGVMHPFLIGDYQRTRFDVDDGDPTVENIRLGVGWQFSTTWGAYVEYAEFRFGNTLKGPGLHLRATHRLAPVSLAIDVGYLDLDNNRGPQLDGLEAGIAASVPVMQAFSALVDYRATVVSPKDGGNSATLSDLRVGVRYDW